MAARIDNRWTRMDDNLRYQVDHFKLVSGMSNEDIAQEMQICRVTLERKLGCPSRFKLEEIRKLATVFKAHGASLDMTLGEGAAAC